MTRAPERRPRQQVAIPSNRGCCPTIRGGGEMNINDTVAIPSNRGCCPTTNGEPELAVEVQTVAIPSNRGCCPTSHGLGRRRGARGKSQSPQIGAAVLPVRGNDLHIPRRRSQSPQIGAAVLPRRRGARGNNHVLVAIPSNRGCCPTPRTPERRPRQRSVAIPSNRGCCPTHTI